MNKTKTKPKSAIKKFTPPVTVAVVGAGAVGQEMIRILQQREFPIKELRVLARSSRSLDVDGITYEVRETVPESFDNVQIALFAGTEGEKGAAAIFSKEAVARGAVLIDNGSDFRMDPKVPLVIPEINPEDLVWHSGIISNPNCTASVMLMPVAPLAKKYGLKKIILSTYQAVSGAGAKALAELRSQTETFLEKGEVKDPGCFPDPIAFNVLSHNWKIEDAGYSNEELKVIAETRKILHNPKLAIAPTTVRVPVFNAHSESIYLELKKNVSLKEIIKTLSKAPGVIVVDESCPLNNKVCPMPVEASGRDEVLVGRIRKDPANPKGVLLWACGDNLRKGAALNAVQIAECLIR